MKLESVSAEGTWHDGTWNDWRLRTQITGVPRVHHSINRNGRGTNGSDSRLGQGRICHNGIRSLTSPHNDPRQYGDGRSEVIPTFDGADSRQYERRIVCLCPIHGWPQREGLVNWWSDWKDGHSIREGTQDLETPNGVGCFLDHLRTHCEAIEVFRRGRIVDDFVYDFKRQPGEEFRDNDTRFNILLRRFEAVAGQVNPLIKAHVFLRKANLSAEKQSQIVSAAMSRYEYEPLRDAMLNAIPRAGALRGGVPLLRKQSGAYSAQDGEDEGAHVLEESEVSGDELEASTRK